MQGLSKQEYLTLSHGIRSLLEQGRLQEAENDLEALLVRVENGVLYSPDEADRDLLWIFFYLGRVAEMQNRMEDALCRYENAAEILGSIFDDGEDVEPSSPELYGALGSVSGQLGASALQEGDLATAVKRFDSARRAFDLAGDLRQEAVTWHLMGSISLQAGNTSLSEHCFLRAARIYEQIEAVAEAATSYHSFGQAAQHGGRFVEAEKGYLRSAELAETLPDQGTQAYASLTDLYLLAGNLDLASQYAARVAEALESIDDSLHPWRVLYILARTAQATGDTKTSQVWLRRAQDSFFGSDAAQQVGEKWDEVISSVVAVGRSNRQPSSTLLEALDLATSDDRWSRLGPAIRRILAGERDLESLRIGLDVEEFFVVHSILNGLARPTQPADGGDARRSAVNPGSAWEEVIRDVVSASRGDASASARLMPFLDSLSSSGDWGQLAERIERILKGERGNAELIGGLEPFAQGIVKEILQLLG